MEIDSRKQALLDAIAKEERRVADLAGEQEEARGRLRALHTELATLNSEPRTQLSFPASGPAVAPTTSADKVALFRRLFRGRHDVFPKLWTNPRKGKQGYAPACSNEWVRGVCEKPRVKCGECPNQAFVPVGDQEILDHLQGRHVVGAYPLLRDDTCWFLAADFDGSSWADDVAAFAETCQTIGLPVSVERSRSGNGAHAWFFFGAPVAASTARRMGCYLITESMARRHQLSMTSYDRLFPNQDTMPRGGFGNLIALPLQHEPRQRGNTVFLDDRFVPYADQWAYLAAVERIAPTTVEAIAEEASRLGRVIGVRMASTGQELEHAAPWTRPPSGRPRLVPVTGPLPAEVRAVLAQRLFMEKAGLPSSILNQIKRLAAFQNPEFYQKQSLRLSTALTPRVIACAEELAQHIALPRGCLRDLTELLREYGISLTVEDERSEGTPLNFTFTGHLSAVQEEAVAALLKHDCGVFVAPPGVGKTVVGAFLVAARARTTLVLVHRKPLLDQWVAQLSLFLGLQPHVVGQIGGGRHQPNGRLDVAMIQSLGRKGKVADIVGAYGHVLVDECHHVPAVSFERVLSEVKARYLAGLTATPYRRDGHQPIIEMQCGPVRYAISPRSEAARRPFQHRLICRETDFRITQATAGIQEIYAAMANDERRNRLILDDVIGALDQHRSPILLTERKDHLDYLADQLRGFTHHLIVLQGGMSAKAQREIAARLSAIPEHEERLVLATGRYIGEGFDDARLDTLFLTMPVSWKGTLVQYTGRLHRLHATKSDVRIYDYVDREVPMLLRMFEKRLRGYRSIGYSVDEPPLERQELKPEPAIEWDKEALAAFGGSRTDSD